MDKEAINPTLARRLLEVLDLQVEAKESDIKWALGIIHQIPGYGAVSLAKAAQDRTLKEVLIAIAREEIAPTMPKDLKNLLEKAEERKAAAKEEAAKGEKEAKEFVQQAQEAAKKVEVKPEPPPEVTPQEPEAIGIQIDYGPANPIAKMQSYGARSALVGAASKIAKDAPEKALSLYLIANGVTSTGLTKSTETLAGREKDIASQIIQEMRGQETSLSSLVNLELLRRSMPSQNVRINILTRADISQAERAQIMAFMTPGGGVSSFGPPRQSFLGRFVSDVGGQIFGRLKNKVVGKVVGKAVAKGAAALGGKAAAAVVGAAGGPPGWAVALASFLPDAASWLKRNGAKVAIAIGSALFGAGFLLQGTAFAAASSPLMLGGGAIAGGGFVGSSGGVGNALSKSANFASNVLTGLGSLAVVSIATPLIVALISIPVVVALILFIINSGAYIVPPAPTFESPFFGESVNCSKEKAPVPFGNSASSPIPKRAWQITADLYQGFWCFWNRSPGDFPGDITSYPPAYPQLFNEVIFKQNPNPSREAIQGCGDCMFWCTYLVQKAFREGGNRSLAATLWAPTMQDDFAKRGKFVSSANATPKNVLPGSVVFFKVASGPERTNHVGIVYSVNQDSILYLQSNAPTKSGSLVFNSSGKGIQSPSGLGVVGIGLP